MFLKGNLWEDGKVSLFPSLGGIWTVSFYQEGRVHETVVRNLQVGTLGKVLKPTLFCGVDLWEQTHGI